MANPNTSEKSVSLDREENITKGRVAAKKVAVYSYDSTTDTLIPGVTIAATPTLSSVSNDVFGSSIMGSRYNQVEIDFSTAAPSAITTLTLTAANGGTSGTGNGQASFSTSTNANGSIQAVTNTSVSYRPHAETYVAFSAIFTTGVASSVQRIGLFNANNGFFVGYEGTSFGITKRVSGVDTTVARTSFNTDTLTGGTDSKFTRNGVPEALDPTKDNLYRIRFGWLGAANTFFEVLSPDETWVTFHIIRQPNANTIPSIASPNLPITLQITKTAGDATNITMNTACWAAGSTSNLAKVTDTITDNSLAALNRSVITGVTTAGGGAYVNVKVNPSGALATAATIADGDDIVSGNTADAANTTGTTGTMSGKLRGIVQNQTNGTQRTKITDGTNNAGIIDPATIGVNTTTATSELDGVIVGPTTKTVTYSLSAAGNSAYYDVANYASVKVQITSQYTISGGSSTITFQTSNDATNWYSQSLVSAAGSQSSGTSSTSGSGIIYVGNLGGRYFRVNLSGTYVSGTAAGVITFSTATYAPHSVGVSAGFNSGSNTGSITSATSTFTSATITGYTWALLRVSGTYSGVTFSIQQSDDSQTTFLATPVYDIGNAKWLQLTSATTSPSISPADNSTRLFAIPLYASGTVVRVVASAWTSGTANLRATYTAVAPFHFSTAPAQGNTGSSTPAAADYIGGIATTALPTAATAGNLIGAMVDKFGRQVVLNNSIRDLMGSQTTTISASTTETTIVTAAASVFNDLSAIWFNNTSATAVRVDVRDTTAGSVIWQVYVPAGDMRGISFNTPYPQTSVNTNWTATCSASITDLRVTALFVKNR